MRFYGRLLQNWNCDVIIARSERVEKKFKVYIYKIFSTFLSHMPSWKNLNFLIIYMTACIQITECSTQYLFLITEILIKQLVSALTATIPTIKPLFFPITVFIISILFSIQSQISDMKFITKIQKCSSLGIMPKFYYSYWKIIRTRS